jgi:uncharacterized protein YegL
MSKKKPVTHVALILDRSGSMSSIQAEAIGAFNDQLKVIQEAELDGNKNFVTLVTFSTHVDEPPHYFDVAAKKVPQLTDKNYTPQGGTALLDAMASTIKKLKELPDAKEENTSFLVCVITDGEENSSKEYSRFGDGPKRIGEMIKELEATQRWTFTYLCANVDPTKIRETLNISASNISVFSSDSRGTMAASDLHSASTTSYFKGRAEGMTSTPTFYAPPKDLDSKPSVDLLAKKDKKEDPQP